jgi:hypothetical protein
MRYIPLLLSACSRVERGSPDVSGTGVHHALHPPPLVYLFQG